MHEPGRQASADEYDLAQQPYLLDGDGPWPPPRGAQRADLFAPRLLGNIDEPRWPEDGAEPDPALAEPDWPLRGPRHRAPAGRSLASWSVALRRPPRLAALGAVAVIIAIAGALIGLLPASRAGRCAGGRPCHAAAAGLPGLSPGHRPAASTRPPAVRASPRPSLPSPPELTPTPTATSEPSPATFAPVTTPPLAGITVSFTIARFWYDGFEGKLTIVNGGPAPVDDWQLAVVLPGDQVLVAWNARFRAAGATVLLTPHVHQAVIEPGASLSEHFIARGTNARPLSCTFNGAPCS